MVNAAVMQLTQEAVGVAPNGVAANINPRQNGASDGSAFCDLLSLSLGNVEVAQGPEKPDGPVGDSADPSSLFAIAPDAAAVVGAVIAQLVTSANPVAVQPEVGVEQVEVVQGPAARAVPVLPQAIAPTAGPEGSAVVAVPAADVAGAEPMVPQPVQGEAPVTAAAVADTPVEAQPLPEAVVTPAGVPTVRAAPSDPRASSAKLPEGPAWMPVATPELVSMLESVAATEANPDTPADQSAERAEPRAASDSRSSRTTFLLAAPPARVASPTGAGSDFRVGLQAGNEPGHYTSLDTSRIVQAVQTPAQMQDRPADAGEPMPRDGEVSDAVSGVVQAGSFERIAAEVAATRTSQPANPSAELHQRIIDQVVRAVSVHKSEGRTDMIVKLNPPELGSMSIHVTQDAQGLTSQIQATSDNVRSLLQAHLPLLADALADVGVRVNSVTVTSDASLNTLMHNSAQESGQQQYDTPRHALRHAQGDVIAAGAISMSGGAAAAVSLGQSAGYSWLA